MRILIVEDNGLIAMMLADELEHAGHEVLGPAEASAAAFDLIQKATPEIAFIDLDLSDGPTGGKIAEHLFSETGCLVVLATGRDDLAGSLTDCAHALLPKPYDCDDVVAIAAAVQQQDTTQPSWPKSLKWM